MKDTFLKIILIACAVFFAFLAHQTAEDIHQHLLTPATSIYCR